MSNRRTRKPRRQVKTWSRWRKARLVLWIVIILIGVALLVARAGKRGQIHFSVPPGDDAAIKQKNGPVPFSPAAAAPPAQDSLIDDDGRTLWVSPTDGPPLDLSYLPPGSQLIIALRPQALRAHPEGEKVLEALGPLGLRGARFLENVLLDPPGVESAVIGCQVNSDGYWTTTLVVRIGVGHTAREHLQNKLPNAIERSAGGQTYWLADDWAYYLPSGDDRLIVVASEQSIAETIELDGSPPPLRRDVERLLAHTDAERHVTIVFAPNFLFSDGAGMFAGQMAALRKPLFWFLGDELSAAALSLHWDDNFFVELVATPTLDTPGERAARILAERLRQAPDLLEDFIAGHDPSPYSRQIVQAFPRMVKQMIAYSRVDAGRGHVVLRCYLPSIAGHNLLMATELTLAEARKGGQVRFSTASATAAAVEAESEPVPLYEGLRRVTSLRLARDTLEAALEQLGQDIGVPILIRGDDLQTEGITKNQSLAIDVQDRPAEEILIEILRLANPDKAATGPGDERQKLVYVARPGADGVEQIVVTTRGRAAERGEMLPPVFQAEQR